MGYYLNRWNMVLFYIKLILISFAIALPANGHNIQVAGDVAGLWHVEPNHNPKAGEEAQAWVALTRKGGKIVPFEQLSCQMGVYSQPRQPEDKPILQPNIAAISAEKYRNIPGAKITFPQAGLYQLQLDCQPAKSGAFASFQLTHDVTVIGGSKLNNPENLPTQSKPNSSKKQANTTPNIGTRFNFSLFIIVPGLLTISGLGVFIVRQRRN